MPDEDRVYNISYETRVPAGTADSTVFGNTVKASKFETIESEVKYITAGGDGGGTRNQGGFEITKVVSGSGAGLVDTAASYTVNYSYTANNVPVSGTLTVSTTDSTTDELAGIPTGTVVTLSELAPTAIDGATWGTPVFSGDGVTPTADGATITIGDRTEIAVTLTNPIELQTGGFDVTKSVTGSIFATELVPTDKTYSVTYSHTLDGETVIGALEIANGETDGLADLPTGTVVTLSEIAPTNPEGVLFGTPIFSGDGVTATATGATIVIGPQDSTVSVALENPVTVQTGGFEITKTVTGSAEAIALAPKDATYSVTYQYTKEGDMAIIGTLEIANGEIKGLDGIASGTIVTLSEVTPTNPTGAIFGTPVFSGEGVTATETGATIVIGPEGSTVAVALENPITVVPPVPPTNDNPKSEKPPVKAPPATPPTLAQTGNEIVGLGLLIVALLSIGTAFRFMARRSAKA